MMKSSDLLLGYNYDKWYGYGLKEAIYTDISSKMNSHTLLCGMSGGGKSFATNVYLGRISLANQRNSKVYFADFKQDDQFAYLRKCPRYYPYDTSLEALETVYGILHKRQSGEDTTRNPITLIWDEYMANILALQSINKKKADEVMRKVSEILMLGAAIRSIYEMLIPKEYIDCIGDRKFGVGEGVVLLQGSQLRFIKVPMVRNVEKMQQVCIDALTR